MTNVRGKGEDKWLCKDSLYVDETYQRPGRNVIVKKIVKNFDENLFGLLTVVQNGSGTYAVVDGGQRLRAAMQITAIDRVRCLVFPSMSIPEQAQFYLNLNVSRVTPSSVEFFIGQLAAGDDESCRVRDELAIYGLKVAPGGGKNNCSCPKVLLDMRTEVLQNVLDFVVHVWPNEPKRLQKKLLQGLAMLEVGALWPKELSLIDKAIKDQFCEIALTRIYKDANRIKADLEFSNPKSIRRACMDIYNNKRRGKNRLTVVGE